APARPRLVPPRRAPPQALRGGLLEGRAGPRFQGPAKSLHLPDQGVPMTITARRRATFLPFSRPHLGEEEIREVVECLKSGWITTGPRTEKFEKDFAAYVGAKHAIALSSGT